LIAKVSREEERQRDIMRRYSKLEFDFRSRVELYEESSKKAGQDREDLINTMKLNERESR
jgi:hypothetical protein